MITKISPQSVYLFRIKTIYDSWIHILWKFNKIWLSSGIERKKKLSEIHAACLAFSRNTDCCFWNSNFAGSKLVYIIIAESSSYVCKTEILELLLIKNLKHVFVFSIVCSASIKFILELRLERIFEWGWTARIAIARQKVG
jgi:hypothetical protein